MSVAVDLDRRSSLPLLSLLLLFTLISSSDQLLSSNEDDHQQLFNYSTVDVVLVDQNQSSSPLSDIQNWPPINKPAIATFINENSSALSSVDSTDTSDDHSGSKGRHKKPDDDGRPSPIERFQISFDVQRRNDYGPAWLPQSDDSGCSDEIQCSGDGVIHMSIGSSEGLTVPEGINLTIRCTVTSPVDMTPVSVDWEKHSTSTTSESERPSSSSSPSSTVHVSEERFERPADGTSVVISTLRLTNVTSERDSDRYVCSARSRPRCCWQTATIHVHVYVPPSNATDFAIVCVVCFLEFVVILYCKTKNSRVSDRCRSDPENGIRAGQSSVDYEVVPRTSKEAELIEQQQQQHVLT